MEDNMETVASAVNFIVPPAFNKIHLLLTGVDSAYVRLLTKLQAGSMAYSWVTALEISRVSE